VLLLLYCEQYGIKKRDSDGNVTSLAARDDGGRKKLSSAGLSGDLQPNQGAALITLSPFYFDNFSNTIKHIPYSFF